MGHTDERMDDSLSQELEDLSILLTTPICIQAITSHTEMDDAVVQQMEDLSQIMELHVHSLQRMRTTALSTTPEYLSIIQGLHVVLERFNEMVLRAEWMASATVTLQRLSPESSPRDIEEFLRTVMWSESLRTSGLPDIESLVNQFRAKCAIPGSIKQEG